MYLLLKRLSNRLFRLPAGFLIIFSGLFIIVASGIIYVLEPDTFSNPFNALWYVMTTLTTVGYGDFYPVTAAGKLFAIFLYLFGIGLLSLVIGKIIDLFVNAKERRIRGKVDYPNGNHIIIIHWNKKAQSAVDELLSDGSLDEIVIIDDLERMPVEHPRVHFISERPGIRRHAPKSGHRKSTVRYYFWRCADRRSLSYRRKITLNLLQH